MNFLGSNLRCLLNLCGLRKLILLFKFQYAQKKKKKKKNAANNEYLQNCFKIRDKVCRAFRTS